MNGQATSAIERLETRLFLSVTRLQSAAMQQDILYIEGTSRADTIHLSVNPPMAGVTDQQFSLYFPRSEGLVPTVYNVKDFSRIIVRANPVRDQVVVDRGFPITTKFIPDTVSQVWSKAGVLAIEGGKGSDIIRVYRNRKQSNDITVVLNGEQSQYSSAAVKVLLISGNRRNDDIAIGNLNLPNFVFGGDGDDTMTGDSEDDYFSGGGGANSLLGGAGNDRLSGGDGADFIDGGDGGDVISAEGAATILGGNGDDSLLVGVGNAPRFTGGAGRDTLQARIAIGDTAAIRVVFLDYDPLQDDFSPID